MNAPFAPVYLTIAIIVSAIIGFYAWRHRDLRGCRAFAILILVSIMWMSGTLLANLNPEEVGQWMGRPLRYLGITFVPAAVLVFVYQYCGSRISRRAIILISVVPFISWLVLADPIHHFFPAMAKVVESEAYGLAVRKQYFWWVHIPYCYGLLAVSLVKVFSEIRKTSKQHRRQFVMLFVAMCFPIAADLIGLAGVLGPTTGLGGTNFSSLSFLIFFVLMGVSIYRYQFLGSSPIAYEKVFHTIRDSVIILDGDDIIQDINKAAAWRLDKEPADVIGLSFNDAFAGSPDLVANYEAQTRALEDIHMTITDAERYLSLIITPIEELDGRVSGRIVTLHDVTDRKQQQITLETMAFYDPLTRLANRRKFQQQVEIAIKESWKSGKRFALLYFDLNRFKQVNDTLGHDVGDELLKYVAARTASVLRNPDLIARMGGDEFAVLLNDTDEEGAGHVVERMLEKVVRPFNVGEHTLTVSLSIGAAFYPTDGQNLTELLRHADMAMYRAKSQGGGLNLYSPGSEMEN